MIIEAKEISMSDEPSFDEESTLRVVNFLTLLPNGVITMSADIEGLVETSLNVGILRTNANEVVASSAIRSSIESAKHKVNLEVGTLTKVFGGFTESHGEYPGWQYNPDSKLRADMIEIYKKLFGKDVKVEAMHAGLECGIMISKLPGLDCVSFGPDIFDIHTTEEKLSISSTERMWKYILEILKA
jgi:dipeptidase D